MNLKRILAELKAEKNGLEAAIAAIIEVYSTGRGKAGHPPKAVTKPRRRGRMSAAARRKMSRLLKQRWAQGKMGRKARKVARG